MRAFNTKQCDNFLNAFGQEITNTTTGAIFTGIVENAPYYIEGSENTIAGYEYYFSTSRDNKCSIGDVIQVVISSSESTKFVIYNIEDDLSGMVNHYFRSELGQSFAEDY